ncbi:coiled-coil domain-containing protein-domain-containing protein [Cokeromyces recurvatus]|uniref:coiled-coil domain-containing protein-domain-containing protein n=1 Tax=Cokeromyces recurvatus TaxID=90255 RepID=UPI00221F7D52|nr:coiled-coil domain-containing protein-domain-containing protein [Cokeromyces recurvatus]KAI7906300.1 coiled-coil domain-containing protein-domain-containing protein [Cokeromyces recurvatus]
MDDSIESQIMTYVERNLSNIPFKTLRYGETELDPSEKLSQMRHILHNDPGLFLSKWGRHLSQNTLRLFDSLRHDYEVRFYLDTLLYQSAAPVTINVGKRSALQQVIQNRRYEFLKRTLRHSDYFSDEAIQLREPILYNHYVGKYIPSREKRKPFANDVTLVDRILSNMDRNYVDEQVRQQKIKDEEQFQEEEESDDDEEEESMKDEKGKEKDINMINEEEESDEEEKDNEFRERKRQELIRLLEEQFLAGKDNDFNYSEVDYNEDYDNLQQQEQDIHDKYFDED